MQRYKLLTAALILGFTLASCSVKTDDKGAEPDLRTDVVTWVEETAVPLTTLEHGNGFEDLQALGEMIGEARLVGFGEATHGNREIYRLKHRVFEYLVEEKNFTIFALESPFAESADLNDYVLHGNGSAEQALASLTMWAWDTEEVADILDWMRAYNADPSNEVKLKVYGFDTQGSERAARLTLDYLDRTDPEFAVEARAELGSLARPFSDPDEMGWRPVILDEADEASVEMAQRVLSSFDENRDAYIARSSEREWSDIRQMALQVLWWVDAYSQDSQDTAYSSNKRDLGMADNIDWIIDREGETRGVFIWAHNSHLANATIDWRGGYDVLGLHLTRRHGENYVSIAGLVDRGGMTALEAAPDGVVQTFQLPPSGSKFLESHLVDANLDIALLDMHAIPDDGPVHDYFSEPVLTRHSGGGYNIDRADDYALAYRFPEAFDIVAFVKDNTPTHIINIKDYGRVPILSEPANLGFEEVDTDSLPVGWFAWSKPLQRWGYSVSLDTDAVEGGHSARLCRETGYMSPDVAGSLLQRIDVSSLHDENLTLRMRARHEPGNEHSSAFLRMKIMPPDNSSAHDPSLALYDNLDSDLVESSEWADYTLEAEFPEGSGSIIIGLYLRGEGCAWIDDVRWEITSD